MSVATTCREIGMTFRNHEVRAILEGRKTQTRQVVKNPEYFACLTGDCSHDTQSQCDADLSKFAPCNPGDVIWVREAFSMNCDKKGTGCVYYKADKSARYALAENGGDGDWTELSSKSVPKNLNWSDCVEKWRPSTQMPRWAARLFLRVKSVRVERLQEINERDAIAEGFDGDCGVGHIPTYLKYPCAYHFAVNWEQLYGGDSWSANPWVWVIEFENVQS